LTVSTPPNRSRRLRRLVAIGLAAAVRRTVGLVDHGGTSLPGMLAERVDPTILASLSADLGRVILVVGTNGKTTTARLTARIMAAIDGRPPIANRSGANLRQGLTSTLVAEAALRGGLLTPGRTAVFEVDELALPGVLEAVRPSALVITNLFRDQLDRYGEVDTVIDRWRAALAHLPATTVIVACGDDPRVDHLAADSTLRTIRFGLRHGSPGSDGSPEGDSPLDGVAPAVADPVACPSCGTPLVFAWRSIGHLGDWACPLGHVRRAEPDLTVQFDDTADGPSRLRFLGAFGESAASVHLSGASGAYDAAAAVGAAMAVGVQPAAAIRALDGATPAFGRLEEMSIGPRRIVLALAKNPASLTESANAAASRHPDAVLLGLSDESADGRDVSWIWDVDFERLRGIPAIGLTGTRADDLVLRLKYARLPAAAAWPIVAIEPLVDRALDAMLARIQPGGTLVVLATYTSLLGIRRTLERRGVVSAIPR
jgi:lipid II isoglutaminyl synthase (glutamine-hydrolysing)